MIFLELIKTAWQSLRTNPRRSILTMVGIVIGIASVITIMALGNGVKREILSQFKLTSNGNQTTEIDFYQKNSDSTVDSGFSENDINLIKEQFSSYVQDVKIVQVEDDINVDGVIGNKEQSVSIALSKGNSSKFKIIGGRNLLPTDNSNNFNNALINIKLAKKEYGMASNSLNTSITVGGENYRIVGFFSQSSSDYDANIVLPKNTFESSRAAQNGNTMKVTFQRGVNASKKTKNIVSFLEKRGTSKNYGKYEYTDMGSTLKEISSVINMLTYFISAIAAISLFIAGIGVMNMMYISVSERTQEIGIRLAVGAQPSNIMIQFLLESVMLTLTGGLLGFLFGWALASLISLILPFKAVVTLGSFLLAAGVSSSVGIIFGILPARQAAQKNLIDTLR
ncbi:ABC transporter permease [Lactiplantibacillus paraplantarum]|uniref:ABC transporter permease n=1 Tax=Lactiplantibacillus paraplantarum TaxID=60520 RepID=UPI003B27CCBE